VVKKILKPVKFRWGQRWLFFFSKDIGIDIHPAHSATGIPKTHNLGFCFSGTSLNRFTLFGSYSRSTDINRKPCSKNIFTSILISIVMNAAFRAIPLSNI
jgi:hypothetical protein